MRYTCPTCHRLFDKPFTIDLPTPIVLPGKEALQDKKYEKFTGPYCPFCYAEFWYRTLPQAQPVRE